MLEIKGSEARVLLDGHPAVTLKLDFEQRLRSLSLEADGDKHRTGIVWLNDISVTPIPSTP